MSYTFVSVMNIKHVLSLIHRTIARISLHLSIKRSWIMLETTYNTLCINLKYQHHPNNRHKIVKSRPFLQKWPTIPMSKARKVDVLDKNDRDFQNQLSQYDIFHLKYTQVEDRRFFCWFGVIVDWIRNPNDGNLKFREASWYQRSPDSS